jgi:hypothetical protein
VAGDLCTSDGTNSQCREFCITDSDCKQPAVPAGGTAEPGNVAHCLIDITGSNPDQKVCTVACDPVSAEGTPGCGTGLACLYTGATGISELTDCETPGTVAEGSSCSAAADPPLSGQCGGELVCIIATTGSPTTGKCRAVCKAGNNSDCATGSSCTLLSGAVMFGICCPNSGACY